jgi:hypothetical protein
MADRKELKKLLKQGDYATYYSQDWIEIQKHDVEFSTVLI